MKDIYLVVGPSRAAVIRWVRYQFHTPGNETVWPRLDFADRIYNLATATSFQNAHIASRDPFNKLILLSATPWHVCFYLHFRRILHGYSFSKLP